MNPSTALFDDLCSDDVLIVQGDFNAELFYVVGEGECSVLVSVPGDFKTIKVVAADDALATVTHFDCL